MTRMNKNQNRHNLQIKSNVYDNDLAPLGELYLKSDKIIEHLPDSAEGKARCSLHRLVGI